MTAGYTREPFLSGRSIKRIREVVSFLIRF